MRKIALPCYSLRWRLRLVRKACAHSLSLLELAVPVKHVKWALLLLLLLLSVVPHMAAQTSTYTVSIKPAVCQAIENCYLFNNDGGNNGEGSISWADVQPNSSMFQIFGYGQPNPSLECTGATFTLNNTTMYTATTIIITCSGTSQIDGTPYTLYETVNYAWSKPPYYSKYMFHVSGGKMTVNASQATLHGLGLPGY